MANARSSANDANETSSMRSEFCRQCSGPPVTCPCCKKAFSNRDLMVHLTEEFDSGRGESASSPVTS